MVDLVCHRSFSAKSIKDWPQSLRFLSKNGAGLGSVTLALLREYSEYIFPLFDPESKDHCQFKSTPIDPC